MRDAFKKIFLIKKKNTGNFFFHQFYHVSRNLFNFEVPPTTAGLPFRGTVHRLATQGSRCPRNVCGYTCHKLVVFAAAPGLHMFGSILLRVPASLPKLWLVGVHQVPEPTLTKCVVPPSIHAPTNWQPAKGPRVAGSSLGVCWRFFRVESFGMLRALVAAVLCGGCPEAHSEGEPVSASIGVLLFIATRLRGHPGAVLHAVVYVFWRVAQSVTAAIFLSGCCAWILRVAPEFGKVCPLGLLREEHNQET